MTTLTHAQDLVLSSNMFWWESRAGEIVVTVNGVELTAAHWRACFPEVAHIAVEDLAVADLAPLLDRWPFHPPDVTPAEVRP